MNNESFRNDLTIHDFSRELNVLMQKWTAEGNKDYEPSQVRLIEQHVLLGIITAKEGVAKLYTIDQGRIER